MSVLINYSLHSYNKTYRYALRNHYKKARIRGVFRSTGFGGLVGTYGGWYAEIPRSVLDQCIVFLFFLKKLFFFSKS